MKTVILVSYHFPPYGGKAVQRASKLAKYLPSYGWKQVVFTMPLNEKGVPMDASLLDELPPGVDIHRPSYFDWWRLVPHDIRKHLYSPLPDKYRTWAEAMRPRLVELIRSTGADALVSTSPTHSAQVLALRAKQATGIPWIADFRDPWSGHPYFARKSRAGEMFELETGVVTTADAVVGVYPKILRDFRDRVPDEHLHQIENGYDEEDFDAVDWSAPPAEEEVLTVGHNGTVSNFHDPAPLLDAIRLLVDGKRVEQGTVRAVFTTNEAGRKRFAPYRDLADAGMLEVRDYLPHAESLAELAKLDVSLLLLTEGGDIYPGKLFEYLRLGNPVLSVSRPGDDLDMLMHDTRAGRVVDYTDTGAIADTLKTLLDEKRTGVLGHLAPEPERIGRYSRRDIARRYAELLDVVAG